MPDHDGPSTPGPRVLSAVALAYAALALAWTAPMSLSPADSVPDLGDPLHLAWVMAWNAHRLVTRPWALFDSNSFHPYPASLTFGDHLLPQAILAAPVFWATGNAVLASNAALLTALVLSATSMFALVSRAAGSRAAGFLAGACYAFNSFTRSELARVQVVSIEWWPLALLFLARFVRTSAPRDAALCVALLALQALSGAYYLVYTALFAPLWLCAAYAACRRLPTRRELGRLAVPALAATAVGAALLWPYTRYYLTLSFAKPISAGTDVACHLTPPWAATLGGRAAGWACPDASQYVGLVAFALALVGALTVGRLRGEARAVGFAACLSAGLGLALAWGPTVQLLGAKLGPGPFAALYQLVPPARSMDGPARAMALAVLGVAILAGLGASRLLRHGPRGARGPVAAVLAAALCLEHWSGPLAGERVPTGDSLPPVYAWLAAAGREPMLELPVYDERAKRLRALYLYFSTRHWRPILVGRTSFYPPLHDRLIWGLRDFPDERSVRVLDELGVRTIVVHPLGWPAQARAGRLQALDASPHLRLLAAFENEPDPELPALRLGHERVYRLEPKLPAYREPCAPQAEIPREGWTVRGGGRPGRPTPPRYVLHDAWRAERPTWAAEHAVDGDRRTAFTTEMPQRPGDFLEIVMPQAQRVAAIALERSYPFDEFPRQLAVSAAGPGGWRGRLALADAADAEWAELAELVERPASARSVLRFEPRVVRRIRLSLEGRSDVAWPAWSVPEVRLYSRCGAE